PRRRFPRPGLRRPVRLSRAEARLALSGIDLTARRGPPPRSDGAVASSLRGPRKGYWLTRTWLARGPFGLDSTLNVTLSPPRRESKLSTPSRWKKYSSPSEPAMKPKPRSDTIFLMVPFAIEAISMLLELSCCPRSQGRSRRIWRLSEVRPNWTLGIQSTKLVARPSSWSLADRIHHRGQ